MNLKKKSCIKSWAGGSSSSLLGKNIKLWRGEGNIRAVGKNIKLKNVGKKRRSWTVWERKLRFQKNVGGGKYQVVENFIYPCIEKPLLTCVAGVGSFSLSTLRCEVRLAIVRAVWSHRKWIIAVIAANNNANSEHTEKSMQKSQHQIKTGNRWKQPD